MFLSVLLYVFVMYHFIQIMYCTLVIHSVAGGSGDTKAYRRIAISPYRIAGHMDRIAAVKSLFSSIFFISF